MHNLRTNATSTPHISARLVSVIVRSMDRLYLKRALESLLQQDHRPLEIIVVDATGGEHSPLPDLT